jgi:nitrate/TMAO reductase-like tetraheme cytochrome c subunit
MKRLVVLLLVLGMNQAYAGSNQQPVSNNAKWKEECGSCHVAYPPQLMSAENWERLMGSLNKHFGANAVLDPNENKRILGFLERNAGSGDRYSSASLRISDTPWFKREHHVIAPKEWTNQDVKSRSNCTACHGKLVLGD